MRTVLRRTLEPVQKSPSPRSLEKKSSLRVTAATALRELLPRTALIGGRSERNETPARSQQQIEHKPSTASRRENSSQLLQPARTVPAPPPGPQCLPFNVPRAADRDTRLSVQSQEELTRRLLLAPQTGHKSAYHHLWRMRDTNAQTRTGQKYFEVLFNNQLMEGIQLISISDDNAVSNTNKICTPDTHQWVSNTMYLPFLSS
jgi:hypothetical protein